MREIIIARSMRILPHAEHRLELLNAAQPDRPWQSSDERRRCIICEGIVRVENVIICEERPLSPRISCPHCGSQPSLWVRLGNPLLEKEVWADWEAAMALINCADEDPLCEQLQATC